MVEDRTFHGDALPCADTVDVADAWEACTMTKDA